MLCLVEGCTKKSYVKGLCTTHYKRQWRHGSVDTNLCKKHFGQKCSVEGCNSPTHSLEYCGVHYNRIQRHGTPDKLRADNGTGTINAGGYRVYSSGRYRIYEHVWLAEKVLGKRLPVGAIVHHVNGKPADNRLKNLVICPDQAYHLLLHRRSKMLGIDWEGY